MKIDEQEALCVIYRCVWPVSLTCCLPCSLLLSPVLELWRIGPVQVKMLYKTRVLGSGFIWR